MKGELRSYKISLNKRNKQFFSLSSSFCKQKVKISISIKG